MDKRTVSSIDPINGIKKIQIENKKLENASKIGLQMAINDAQKNNKHIFMINRCKVEKPIYAHLVFGK